MGSILLLGIIEQILASYEVTVPKVLRILTIPNYDYIYHGYRNVCSYSNKNFLPIKLDLNYERLS